MSSAGARRSSTASPSASRSATRFGVLPRWAVRRLDTAAIEQLDGWLEGIFDAQSLEDLIGPRRRGAAKGR